MCLFIISRQSSYHFSELLVLSIIHMQVFEPKACNAKINYQNTVRFR